MHALIADLAVAVLPEIVPVVVNVEPGLLAVHVDHELPFAGRPLPEGPVEIRRHRAGLSVADGATVAVLVNITARLDDLADEAVVHQFHVAAVGRARSVLRAVLYDAAILLRRRHELPPLVNAV